MTKVPLRMSWVSTRNVTVAMLLLTCAAFAQDRTAALASIQPEQNLASAQPANSEPVVITLQEAIQRAEKSDPRFADAVAARKTAAFDRSIARANLLPSVRYHNEYQFTQSSGARGGTGHAGNQDFVFIANNAIHEYASQVSVTETLGLGGIVQLKRADAAAAESKALAEVARRGLVFTVVQRYYGLLAAQQKLRVARRAANQAQDFVDLTKKLEHGREVAHADVLKAQLQLQQRQRDAQNAQLVADNARLELGILLFPDPRAKYTLADDLRAAPPLPARAAVNVAAQKNNPDVRAAMSALKAANEDVLAARAGYLPDLSLNWTYGIDAPQFATNGPFDPSLSPAGKPRNLGYSASATLDIPVWDWFATHNRVKQSEVKRSVAKLTLTQAQKRLLVDLNEYYDEAKTAEEQTHSLDQSMKDATESLRLTELRYKAGEATALEVVDAQNALAQAEQAHADGAVRYRVALANLQTLTGALP